MSPKSKKKPVSPYTQPPQAHTRCCHPSPLRASCRWGSTHTRGYRTEQSQQHRHLATRGHLFQLSPMPGPQMWQHLSTPSPPSSSPASLLHLTSWAGLHPPALHSRLLGSDLPHHPLPQADAPSSIRHRRSHAHAPLPTPPLAMVYHTAHPESATHETLLE